MNYTKGIKSRSYLTSVWNHLLPRSVSSRIPVVLATFFEYGSRAREITQRCGDKKWKEIFSRKFSDKSLFS